MKILSILLSFFKPAAQGPAPAGGGLSTRTWLILLVLAFAAGFFCGRRGAPPAPAVDHSQPVQGEIVATSTTTITYAPKPAAAAPDIKARLGKTSIRVEVNGQEQVFTKTEQEAFALDKNMLQIEQINRIGFAVTVPPVDNTRHYAVGVAAGSAGAGVTFRHDRLGVDIYKGWSGGYGAAFRYEILQW